MPWAGPLKKTPTHKAIHSTRCLGNVATVPGTFQACGKPTINGEFWCYDCKDPGGYAARLHLAQQEARQRCLEAYPVCQRCGERLTQAQVERGQTIHGGSPRHGCILPQPSEPLAEPRRE